MAEKISTQPSPCTARSGFPKFFEAQEGSLDQMNLIFTMLDLWVGTPIVDDASLSGPPGSPADPGLYFVDSTTPTGDWTDRDCEFVMYIDGKWYFLPIPLFAIWGYLGVDDVAPNNVLKTRNGGAATDVTWSQPTAGGVA